MALARFFYGDRLEAQIDFQGLWRATVCNSEAVLCGACNASFGSSHSRDCKAMSPMWTVPSVTEEEIKKIRRQLEDRLRKNPREVLIIASILGVR